MTYGDPVIPDVCMKLMPESGLLGGNVMPRILDEASCITWCVQTPSCLAVDWRDACIAHDLINNTASPALASSHYRKVKCYGQCRKVKCSGQCRKVKCSGQCRKVKCSGQCREVKCSSQCREVKCSGQCREVKCSGPCSKVKCSGQCRKVKCSGQCMQEGQMLRSVWEDQNAQVDARRLTVNVRENQTTWKIGPQVMISDFTLVFILE